MSTQTPVVRQIAWWMVILQITILLALFVICALLLWQRSRILALTLPTLLYLMYSRLSRRLLLRHHRQGLRLVRRGDYPGAIAAFERSYEFFSKYPWIDRYRYLTLLMPAAQPLREMALVNIGYAYAQLGDKAAAKAAYQRVLSQFPQSKMAQATLQFIETFERES